MKEKMQLVIKVGKGYEFLAGYCINWDETLREEFKDVNSNEWRSGGEYEVGYDDDSIEYIKKYAEEKLRELGVKEFIIDKVIIDQK